MNRLITIIEHSVTVGLLAVGLIVMAAWWGWSRYLSPKTKTQPLTNNPVSSPVTNSTTQPSTSANTEIQAWIYPGPTTCGVLDELKKNVQVDVLKPEYFTLDSNGDVKLLPESEVGCNGYTEAHAQAMRERSRQQFVTVSGRHENMVPLVSSASKRQAAVQTLTDFAQKSKFTGIEIDFEDFSSWTKTDYQNYLKFIQELGSALHKNKQQLLIAGPPISNQIEDDYYQWNYADFNKLPVDGLVIMAYDYQADQGNGEPVAPNSWVEGIIQLSFAQIEDDRKIVIGIPAYGYTGTSGEFQAKLLTKREAQALDGFDTAYRDPGSYEMTWRNGNIVNFYIDSSGLDQKRRLVEAQGVRRLSVWHLGGNDWFSR